RQVLLVVGLGEVERGGRDDLGGDGAVPHPGQDRLEGVAAGLGGGALRLVVVEDHRAVLGSHVVALAHALGGVVALPEDLEQVGVGDAVGVEDHPYGLGVAGEAAADLLVGGVGGVAARVADGRGDDAVLGAQPPEGAFHAPEAAHAELGDLGAFGVGRGQRGVQDLVAFGDRHRGVATGQRPVPVDHRRLHEAEHGFRLSAPSNGRRGPQDRTPLAIGGFSHSLTFVSDLNRGVLYGASAYFLWGFLPLYWPLFSPPASAFEVLLHRMIWSLAVTLAVLLVQRNWRWVREVLRSPRRLLLLAASAVLISANWGFFIVAVTTGHTLQSALAYFVNPLVSVALGTLVFKERLRAPQWAAVVLGGLAVAVLTVDYGSLPWLALAMAFSFAAYGVLKKFVRLDGVESLTAETAIMVLPALGGVLV